MSNWFNALGARPWRAFIAVFAISTVFMVFALGARPVSSPDEGRYIEIPREMVATGDYVLPRLDGILYFEKPPLFYWLEASAIKAFGISEFSMRLWPVIFGIGGVLMAFGVARKFYGRGAGLASGLILATTLLYYGLSRFIVLDAAVSVLMTATLFAFLLGAEEADRRKQVRWFRWAYFAAALAVLAKGLIGMVLPGAVVVLWIALTGRWRLVRQVLIPSGLLLFFVIAVPWHVAAAMRNHDFLWFYFVHEHFLRYTTRTHHRYGPIWYYIPVLLVGFLPWTGYLWHGLREAWPKSWRLRAERPVELFLVVWATFVFVFFSISDSKLITYILPVFPPLAVLTGRVLAPVLSGEGGRRMALGPWFFAVVFAVLALAVPVVLLVPKLHAIPAVREFSAVVAPLAVVMALVFAVGAIAAVALHRRGRAGGAVVAILFTVLFGWSAVSVISGRADPKSIKPLALAIESRLQPGDTVASYGTFFYDLPVYLRRKVLIVDNVGELQFGAGQEDVSATMMSREAFWKRWHSGERIFMVLRRTDFRRDEGNMKGSGWVLGTTLRAIAVANHPVPGGVPVD